MRPRHQRSESNHASPLSESETSWLIIHQHTLYVLEGRREPDGDLLLFRFCSSSLRLVCYELGYVRLSFPRSSLPVGL